MPVNRVKKKQLKKPVSSILIHSWSENIWVHVFPKGIGAKCLFV